MTASDHLSKSQFRLFHGTNVDSPKGGVIEPSKQEGDEWDGDGPDAAFASTKLEDAASYGKNVFEVHPGSNMEDHGYGVVSDENGFKIKRQIKPEVVDRYKSIVAPIREAKEKREHGLWMHQTNQEEWHHEGDKKYHVKYDKEGNQVKTLLKGRQWRPGDAE